MNWYTLLIWSQDYRQFFVLCQQPNLDSCMVCKVMASNLDTPCLHTEVIPTNYSREDLSKQFFDQLFIHLRLQKIKDASFCGNFCSLWLTQAFLLSSSSTADVFWHSAFPFHRYSQGNSQETPGSPCWPWHQCNLAISHLCIFLWWGGTSALSTSVFWSACHANTALSKKG